MEREIVLRPEKRTLGQVAFEADRENAVRNKMRLLIPTWEELPEMIKENWEVMALRIAKAIASELPDVLQDFSRGAIEVESVDQTKWPAQSTSS